MNLQEQLERYLAEGDVPGAVLGVFTEDRIYEHAAGVLSRRTGVKTTTDSVFQIGSNTKVWTATQVMQLADEGALELDMPVREYLPEFETHDATLTEGVTIRHLLAHTSGLEGDVFDDFGRNDDAIARYVAALSDQGTVHALGETWSYCNSGYVVLGRIVEHLRGKPWASSLRETIAEPLGLDAICVNADEAIMHRAAVGHIRQPDGHDLVSAPYWSLPQAIAPAGLISTTVGDLLTFARMHLAEGKSMDGTQILSPRSVKAMQSPQAECPARELATHWGLGWMLHLVDGRTVIGHGGNTVGQSTYFLAVPDAGVAVALLTNVSHARNEASDVFVRELLTEFAEIRLPPRAEPAGTYGEIDLSRLTGHYARLGVDTTVELVEGRLEATIAMSGRLAKSVGLDEPITFELLPSNPEDERFVARIPRLSSGWVPFHFYGTDGEGKARFLHSGGRAARRVR